MHLNAILFLFGPGPHPLPFSFSSLFFFHAAQVQPAFLPLLPFSPAWPNLPSCLCPSPAQSARAPLLFSFSCLLTDGTRMSGTSPTSSSSRTRTRVESGCGMAYPAVRRPEPACQGTHGHPIKPLPVP
jgi:hypothetical protein